MDLKKTFKKEPVWTILPSYDMYQYTFSGISGPPEYDQNYSSTFKRRSEHLNDTSETFHSELGALENNSVVSSDHLDSDTSGRDSSVLKSIHNLTNLPILNSTLADQVELSVYFTTEAGRSGESPNPIDPLQVEYSSGDLLNGYILMRNTSKNPIPFDIFYVLFEGSYHCKTKVCKVGDPEENVKRFLQMFDLAASWNQFRVKRLIGANQEDNLLCSDLIDNLDGSLLCISGRILMPGVLYKRFFTFKIPDRLLDTECEHNLFSHMVLPPTLGPDEHQNEGIHTIHSQAQDFSFVDTSIRYNVSARFIGKSSYYSDGKLPFQDRNDDFVIFKECKEYVRLIPNSQFSKRFNEEANIIASEASYRRFIDRIETSLALGKKVEQSFGDGIGSQAIKSLFKSQKEFNSHDLKSSQLYKSLGHTSNPPSLKISQPKTYVVDIPVVKSNFLLGKIKRGTITIKFPRTAFIIHYIPPKQYSRDGFNKNQCERIEVPFVVSYKPVNSSGAHIPQILEISTELVVVSIKAGRYTIPLEFNMDHFFQNSSCVLDENKQPDHIGSIVVRHMRKYSQELTDLSRKLKKDQFDVESSLLADVYALAGLKARASILVLRNAQVVEENGQNTPVETRQPIHLVKKDEKFQSSFTVIMDVNQAQIKGKHGEKLPENYSFADEFCLVPSFQNCNAARVYYLQIVISLSTGQKVELKSPVTIIKPQTGLS